MDQPLPNPGKTNVAPVARKRMLEILSQQVQRGIETYGTPLQTHNGRDAFHDAMTEAIDLIQYLTQASLEHADLIAENARLRAEIAELKGQTP
jgi:hypothetical protein